MTNLSKLAICIAAMSIVAAAPAIAQTKVEAGASTMQSEHHTTTVATKVTTKKTTTAPTTHRVVRHRTVRHRHQTPVNTVKKTTTETHTTTDPK
ncbi:hypothetical protein [Sphingomonas sp. GB1N7]|uniref:hypothetical protein n=1 Tax=Parasphingomonas caseinilytica TaxID=3096158 RepID=UPI002FC8B78A